jgi:hypothetical protein
MKTLTSSLLVNRLLTSVFTLIFIFFAGKANALAGNNPGIEYASLAASATEKAVFINWVTASEQNNSHFEVERSSDMKTFKTVAMVLDGFAATGTNGKSYKFKEAAGDVKKGKTIYYRLKQIDTDNQVHYSAIMAVQMNATVTVFPKEANSNVKKGAASTITDIQTVKTTNQTLLSKQSTINMGQNNISAGSSTKPSAGILDAHELILGTELYAPKLSLA